MIKLCFLAIALALSIPSWSQVRPFGNKGPLGMRGNAFIEFTRGEGQVFWTDALPGEKGGFITGGTVLSGGTHYLLLARFLPDGKADCTFQNQGVSEWTIPVDWEYMVKLGQVTGGKIIALFNPPDARNGLSLARFNPDGYLDPAYGVNGIFQIPDSFPSHFVAFKQQADGKLLAGGFIESPEPACIIYRLLADGTLDPGFSSRISSPTGQAFHLLSLAPYPDGKVLITAFHGEQLAVFRLLSDGGLDDSFGENGFVLHSSPGFRPYDLLLMPDGSWIALGTGSPCQSGWPIAVKGDIGGELEPGFGEQGVLYTENAFEAAAAGIPAPDGKWIFAGVGEMAEQTGYFILRRFLADGTPDEAFGADGYLAPCFEEEYFQGTGTFIRSLPGGRLLAGGEVNMKGALICLGPDGKPDPSFGKEGMALSMLGGNNPLDIECCELLYQPDGKILATGSVSKPFDSEILAIRMEGDGAVDPSFVDQGFASVHLPHPVTGVDALLQKDGKLVVGGKMQGDRNQFNNIDFAACRLNPDGSLDTTFGNNGMVSFDCGVFDVLGAIAIQEDGKILLAGDMENPVTLERILTVYRLHPNGKPDLCFGVDGLCAIEHLPNGTFSSLLLQPSGKILLLDAHPPWGFDIVRLLPNGIPDKTFGDNGCRNYSFPDATSNLNTLMGVVTNDDRLLIAGQLGELLGLMSLDAEGNMDRSFGDNGIAYSAIPETAWEMTLLPDGKFLLAGSGCSDVAPYNYFFGVRFLPDGKPDRQFGDGGILQTELPAFSFLTSLLALEDGAVILGGKGYTSESDTHSDILLIRYLPVLTAGHLCPAHQFPFLDVYPYALRAEEFSFSYDLPAQSNVVITLLSAEGKEIGPLLNVCRPEGVHTEWLNMPPGLRPGHYLIGVQTDEVEASVRILYSGE